MDFEVNIDINSKVYLYQGDITKLNVNMVVNSVNKTLIGGMGGDIDGSIHESTESGLLDEFQKLNGCGTGACKVTLGYKLPVKYLFHTVRLKDKSDWQ